MIMIIIVRSSFSSHPRRSHTRRHNAPPSRPRTRLHTPPPLPTPPPPPRPREAHRSGPRARPPRAQLIGLVFVLIFAVLGREFFSRRAPGAFGTFDVSLVTLFATVSTIQQWPDDLPLIFASESAEVYVSLTRFCHVFSLGSDSRLCLLSLALASLALPLRKFCFCPVPTLPSRHTFRAFLPRVCDTNEAQTLVQTLLQ